jgi:uncharacterized protein YndB with AHSA1/START domain
MTGDIASASITVHASPERVWQAITDPETIKKYYFGTTVTSDWKPGSPITWAGEYNGTSYQDKGEVMEAEPGRMLRHTHYSPMSGRPDVPENYHVLTYSLSAIPEGTEVVLEQDGNDGPEAAEHSASNWRAMLEGLKAVVEGDGPR